MIVEAFREISSSPDSSWRIVSDIDSEHKYWPAIHSVHNRRVSSTSIERQVRAMNGLCSFREMVTLRPASIHVHITDGPFTGTKLIEVIPVGQFKTKIHIRWDIKLNRFLRILSPIIFQYIAGQSNKALTKMEVSIQARDSDLVDGGSVSGTIS